MNFKGLWFSFMGAAAFWVSCREDSNTSEESNAPSSQTQAFRIGLNRETAGVYAETITGTPVTFYNKDYYSLSPAAQKIVRDHEKVHQRQNPFFSSHGCRELEAYRLQLLDAKIWLQQNNGERRFDKEAQDVQRLYFDAQELIEFFQEKCENNQ